MTTWKPLARGDVLSRIIDERHRLLYDRTSDAVHVLNLSADRIWRACDGEHTVEEIEAEIRAFFALDATQDLSQDVALTLGRFRERGLLVTPPDAAPSRSKES